ncbi:sugar phosphate isomerase/epimerase family protein [Streptomyces viridochromogenes]|uniref:Xylose isomerase-like TIM barrel domain-containing protein n=1 Tax=Streptomyces viridochromogenes Tue57 TaxID=1160705 RepID=L8PPA4_STRVR|nr:sugar phosphate isomerase/epimerase family protein [Streptomyces viridochromogenes]ELS57868.1 hypothetical protein STVIR_1111 [Streptomyces viridochromogenes Tue57]
MSHPTSVPARPTEAPRAPGGPHDTGTGRATALSQAPDVTDVTDVTEVTDVADDIPLRFGYGTNGLADLRLDDALALLADLGYDGVGLTLDHMHLDPLAPDVAARTRRLAQRLDTLGLQVTVETGARYVLDPRRKHGPSLLDPDPDDRARRVDLLIRAVRIATDLGAHAVHCFSGVTPPETDPETAWHRLADALTPVLDAATTAGLPLAVEPEPGHLLATLADFHRLRHLLGDPAHLGLTLDIGHCQCLEPLSPADCVHAAAPWLRHVQIEDMRRGIHEHLPFGEGEIDFPSVLAALRANRYRGLTVVELPRHSHAGPHFAERSLPFLHRAAATAARSPVPVPPPHGDPSATPEGSNP